MNHCGRLLGFTVEFGRYQGTQSEIGHDGLWHSPTGFSVVVEVKTTDAYSIQTAPRPGPWGVRRRPARREPESDSIVAQKLTNQLRVASVDTLLSLAELVEDTDMMHEEVVAVLRPGGPVVDDLVKLLARVASQGQVGPTDADTTTPVSGSAPSAPETPQTWTICSS